MDNTMLNMPTQQSVGRNSHAKSIDDFNRQLRSQPWYQDWFKQQGLDPNNVHLSQGQRQQLQQLILQKGGVPPDAFNDMKIDPAGNLNTEHGFASQPSWLKALEIGGAATAAAFAAPGSIGSLFGMGGTVAPTAASSMAVPTASISTLPAALASGGNFAAGAGGIAGVTGATTGAAGGTGNLLTRMLHGSPDDYSDAAKMVSSVGEAEANNRLNKGGMAQNYDRLMFDSAANRRTDESDALRKLAQTSYIGSGGSQFKPPTITLGGQQRTAPDLGYGPQAPSDAQKQAASTLQSQLLARVQPGGSYTPQPLSSYADRGAMERAGSYGGMALSGLGAARKIFGF